MDRTLREPPRHPDEPFRLRLGIITDEVSDDPEEACRHIAAWGLAWVELRTAWGKNVLTLDDDELARLERAVRRHQLQVAAIASPVFKSPLDERPREQAADFALEGVETMAAQLDLLERACTLATRFGARMVRVFTFWREPWSEAAIDRVVANLVRAADVARRHGVLLAVENEPVCIVGTGGELGALCDAMRARVPADVAPSLGALWDPGNAMAGGEPVPYPDGYEALGACRLVHVHLKDLHFGDDGRPVFVPVGQGKVDFAGQLARLRADGYQGVTVLEPHYRPAGVPRVDAARACVDAVRALARELGLETA